MSDRTNYSSARSCCVDQVQQLFKMAARRSLFIALFTSAVIALSNVNAYESLISDLLCPGDYDIVVMLDRSTDVTEETYVGYIDLIKKLVDLFHITEGGNHFGLVVYNDITQIIMKLLQNNDITTIKDYLMSPSLPGRQGRRNLQRALRETRQNLLTAAMGDRPDAENVCLLLTTEGGDSIRSNKQYPKIKQYCDNFIVLRKGDYTDLYKVQDAVCPTLTAVEAKTRTIDFCTGLFQCNSNYYNNLTESCNGNGNGNVGSSCPQPYAAVGEYCYLVHLKKRNYDKSLTACQENNGYLARTDTSEEIVVFSNYLSGLVDWELFWIGLRDETGDNMDWHWTSDGSSLTSDNWFTDIPNVEALVAQPDNTGQRCVVANFINTAGTDVRGDWFDTLCSFPFYAVCETDPI